MKNLTHDQIWGEFRSIQEQFGSSDYGLLDEVLELLYVEDLNFDTPFERQGENGPEWLTWKHPWNREAMEPHMFPVTN